MELWLNFKLPNQNEIKFYFTRICKFVLTVVRKIKDCAFKLTEWPNNTDVFKCCICSAVTTPKCLETCSNTL